MLLFVLFLSFTSVLCDDIQVHSSQLEVILRSDNDIEFQLKNRNNVSINDIKPTSTFSNSSIISREEEIRRKYWPKNGFQISSVPLIMSMYFCDRGAVEVLWEIAENKPKNMSHLQWNLIKSYVDEWYLWIEDPEVDKLSVLLSEHSFPELENPYIELPTEIEHMHKIFRMMNRILVQLQRIKRILEELHCRDYVQKLCAVEEESERIFTFEDLESAAFNMIKLSDLYLPKIQELYPNNIKSSLPLKEVLSVISSTAEVVSVQESSKWVSVAEDLLRNAIQEVQVQNNENGGNNKKFRYHYIQIIKRFLKLKPVEKESESQNFGNEPEINITNLKSLCNGKDYRSEKTKSKLSCRYDHLDSPWLYLTPAKLEVLHNDPQILIFHDVIRDRKNKKLQQLALPLQEESKIDTKTVDGLLESKHRFSFVTFIDDIAPEIIQLNHITGYLTRLETLREEDTEPLQINLYRPGGHFMPHFDADVNTNDFNNEKEKLDYLERKHPHGDRMATLMYYLNDVTNGGRTVFTKLGFGVAPEKGSALFWHSLFDDGSLDHRSQHAGCPLLQGLKWVANKWIYYNSQWKSKACSKKRHDLLLAQ